MKRETRRIVNENPELLNIAKEYWEYNHVGFTWNYPGMVRANQNRPLYKDNSRKNRDARMKEIRENERR